MEDTNYSTRLAIRVVLGRNKAAPDSFELFKAMANLALTSKAYNNLLEDLLIILSCRCIRGGGCRFARAKLYGYIRTSNTKKFIACADQIVQTYHSSVYIHIFTKCLIDIVENCSFEFLSSYLEFLKTRSVIVSTGHFYGDRSAGGKYPGFNPMNLVKTLQIANENGWQDKALLLFQHLSEYHSAFINKPDRTAEIKERISENIKLNFDGQLGLQIKQRWKNSARWTLGGVSNDFFNTLLAPKRIELSKVPKEVFDLPVEQQPWFFGYVKNKRKLMEDCSADESFLVTFLGSKLQVCTRVKWRLRVQIFDSQYLARSKLRYYLPNGGKAEYFYIYQFYRAIVEQDLDALKSIHQTYELEEMTLNKLSQPNPLLELFTNVAAPKDEIVQYLIDINMSTDLVPWPSTFAVHDKQLAAIEKLIAAGTIIDTGLIIQLLHKRSFMNEKSFERLINVWKWDRSSAHKLMNFIMEKSKEEYKKHHLFSERLLTVLWIHKYGQSSDGCNHLQQLPKELIKVIIEFVNEPPLFYRLAKMITKMPKITEARPFSIFDIYGSPLYGELLLEAGDNKLLISFINYASGIQCRVIRKNYSWLRRAICEREKLSLNFRRLTLAKYMLKYETDITTFRHLHRHDITMGDWPFIYALKTKNRAALRYFIKERNTFVMPSRDEFELNVKRPKYNITYEEALQLIEQIKSEPEHSLAMLLVNKTAE